MGDCTPKQQEAMRLLKERIDMRITVTAEEAAKSVFEGGVYGEGLDNDATVELVGFDYPSSKMPGWDKEGKKGPWALFTVKIVRRDGERAFFDKYVEPASLAKYLVSVGVELDYTGDGGFTFESDEVAGRKLVGCTIKPPREWNGKLYNGDIINFISE